MLFICSRTDYFNLIAHRRYITLSSKPIRNETKQPPRRGPYIMLIIIIIIEDQQQPVGLIQQNKSECPVKY